MERTSKRSEDGSINAGTILPATGPAPDCAAVRARRTPRVFIRATPNSVQALRLDPDSNRAPDARAFIVPGIAELGRPRVRDTFCVLAITRLAEPRVHLDRL